MPHFFEREHYQAIAHLLTAGDIGARVVSNDAYTGIEVGLEDHTAVIWSNAGNNRGWSWTHIDTAGDMTAGTEAKIDIGAAAEEVARLIATYPYESAPVPTT